jgi:hypothetical protein
MEVLMLQLYNFFIYNQIFYRLFYFLFIFLRNVDFALNNFTKFKIYEENHILSYSKLQYMKRVTGIGGIFFKTKDPQKTKD